MSLAAKIRDYDPAQNSSATVAAELGTSDEYVRVVWQRMDPERKALDIAKGGKWARANSNRVSARKRLWYVKNRERIKATARLKYATRT